VLLGGGQAPVRRCIAVGMPVTRHPPAKGSEIALAPLASELDVKVSLHPAQASRRPCDGPVSSPTTCWLYDTAPKSMPLRGR